MPEITIDQALQLALQHFQSSQLAEAETLYRQILSVQPDHVVALYYLGQLAMQNGHYDSAIDIFENAIALQPDFLQAHSGIAYSLIHQEKFAAAISYLQKVVELDPSDAGIYNDLGNLWHTLKKNDEAIECFQIAIRLRPDFAVFHCNLGNAYKKTNALDRAVECYQRAIELKPDFADAYNNYALVLQSQGNSHGAIAVYQDVIKQNLDTAEIYNNYAAFLNLKGNKTEAIEMFNRAIALQPQCAEIFHNMGEVYHDTFQIGLAEACFKRAIELKPDFVESYCNYCCILQIQGRVAEAIDVLQRQIAAYPDVSLYYSSLFFAQSFHPDYSAHDIASAQAKWRENCLKPRNFAVAPHTNVPEVNRRLKIGYVSPDFRNHCQALFTIPLFKSHDRTHLETHCYFLDKNPDKITDEIRSSVDHWCDAYNYSLTQLAEKIRADGIDILVDLTMHMSTNRIQLFAMKPAPVQVTWLAYPGSTGLDTIDYRLTDLYLDPPGMFDEYYSEKSFRLPDTFWCYDPNGMGLLENLPVAELPALKNGYFTFSCLNNYSKVNLPTLKLWAEVLHAVPRSKLKILISHGKPREQLIETMRELGIVAERIEFLDFQPRLKYMQQYHDIDMALETLPYNGHTTSLDGLWMGVPTISIVGHTVVGRAGLSQLSNLGLSQLVAHSPAEYVNLVRHVVSDLPALSELRRTLRERMQASPLVDATRFARNIEAAYRTMWHTWCEQQPSYVK